MYRGRWTQRDALLLAVAFVLTSFGAAWAAGPQSPVEPPMFPHGMAVEPYALGEGWNPVELSDYWLGLECRPVPPVLRAQLKLPDDRGIVVGQVVPESPAVAAGIEQYDVLVGAAGTPLANLQDLIDAVDASKDKPLALDLIRAGKSTKVKVTPVKRPESHFPQARPEGPRQAPQEWMKRYLDRFAPGEWGERPWRFRFWGPGTILPSDAEPEAQMPGNLQVTIHRSGDKPAKIIVKRGDEKWEVTEDRLGELPDDVRPHVERMLGCKARGGDRSGPYEFVPEWPVPQWEGRPGPGAPGALEKRMEEINRRLEELRKSFDQWRQGRPRLRDVPEPKAEPDEPEKPDQKPDKKPENV